MYLLFLPIFLLLYLRYKRSCEEMMSEYKKLEEENKKLKDEIIELRAKKGG